tara:strand:+ start:369 stop:695 length:327 start_codon:yes stop_codon:yes gene_type:complete
MGGVLLTLVVGVVMFLPAEQDVDNTNTQIVEDVVEVKTPLEVLKDEIYQSDDFQKEMQLMAEARAMYQLSKKKQDEAVSLADEALTRYKLANELENQWKLNQSEVIKE